MLLRTFVLTLIPDKKIIDSPSTLRGFILGLLPDNPLLHHHIRNPDNKGGFIYIYPRVQYKIIDGIPVVLGVGEAVEVVQTISNIKYLDLKGKRYVVINKEFIERSENFGISEYTIAYKFLTPWLALDEESFNRYKRRNRGEKEKQLESIVVGNIISMSKGLEYVITDKITATVNVREVPTSLKGTPMLGFLGNFSVNFEIPDYWGIGKSVSRGFGTIKRV
jgi:uncharacterized protein YbaR (Trm112 family)